MCKEFRTIAKTKQKCLPKAKLLSIIQDFLDDKKAHDIVTIDLSKKSSFADYLVIASGLSGRQVAAMTDTLVTELKKHGEVPAVEGMPQCDWVLIDVGDVVIHLFRPEVRAFYNLEKMWGTELDDDSAEGTAA